MGHIWLIGMMGSGKTTTGELAAEILGRPFLDTDVAVVTGTGRTIPELFEESEATFRDAESAAIQDAAAHVDAVIATGGGSIMREDNVVMMEGSGVIVLLDADAETIAERLSGSETRPLLTTPESIERILHQRESAYREAAAHIITTVGRTPSEIAEEVAGCIDM